MKYNKKTIDALRKSFAISVAMFEMAATIQLAFGNPINPIVSFIHGLHIAAKKELGKDKPNKDRIEFILEMISNVRETHKPKP